MSLYQHKHRSWFPAKTQKWVSNVFLHPFYTKQTCFYGSTIWHTQPVYILIIFDSEVCIHILYTIFLPNFRSDIT